MLSPSGLTIYHNAAGQLYLHLPLAPTLTVLLVVLVILVVKIFSIGITKKNDPSNRRSSSLPMEDTSVEDDEMELPESTQTQVRRLDL